MKLLRGVVLAAVLTSPAAALADTLLSDTFQNYSQGDWVGEGGAVGTSAYKDNVSLRLTVGASATNTISTTGFTDITVSLAFAALKLGAHGGCFADASIDGGANWIRIFKIRSGDDDGVKLHPGSATLPELANQAKVILRLHTAGTDDANCFADDITVTGTPVAGAKPAGGS